MRSLHVLQFLRVTFDPNTGLLSSLSNLETKQSIKLTQNFYWSVLHTVFLSTTSVDTCKPLLALASSVVVVQVQRKCW